MSEEHEDRRAVKIERRQYPPLSSKHIILFGSIIGLALAICLAGVVAIAFRVNKIQQDDIKRNRASLVRLDDAVNRIQTLESPSRAQLQRRIHAAIRSLVRDERLSDPTRKALAKAIKELEQQSPRASGSKTPQRPSTSSSGASTQGSVRPSSPQRRSAGPVVTSSPAAPVAPSPPAPSSSPAPSQSSPSRPPISATTPEVAQPKLCTPIVNINC